MDEKKFKNLQELLDFVLIECGDISYTYSNSKLRIYDNNLNFIYIVYAYQLMWKRFHTFFKELTLQNISEIPENFLIKLDKLHTLNIISQLQTLPKLPNSLIVLRCNNNELTELPELPEGLKYLYCNNNKLNSLPKLQKSIVYIECKNNSKLVDSQYEKWKEESDEFWRQGVGSGYRN